MGGATKAQQRITVLTGIEVGSIVTQLPGLVLNQGKAITGDDLLLIHVLPNAPEDGRKLLKRIVHLGSPGGMTVKRASNDIAVLSPSMTGTLSQVPSFAWRLPRRIEIFQQVLERVHAFHQEGIVLGPLDPAHILLDAGRHPFILGPLISKLSGPYAAPETVSVKELESSADIFSLGKLLYFVMTEKPPPEWNEKVPKLVELATYPAGLSRIIRRATTQDPAQRYPTVHELIDDMSHFGRYEEVGLAHSGVQEQNLTGVSFRPVVFTPQSRKPRPSKDPKRAPSRKSRLLVGFDNIKRKALLIGGVAAGVVGTALSYFFPGAWWTRPLVALGGALAGFSVFKPGIRKELGLRSGAGALVGLALFFLSPTSLVGSGGAQARLSSDDPAARSESFIALAEAGELVFTGADLSGTTLQGLDLSYMELNDASFEDADLSTARFWQTVLTGASFRGTNLSGVQFWGTTLDDTVDLALAICDPATVFPEGWICAEGHPKRR